jgi:hypothetical protein
MQATSIPEELVVFLSKQNQTSLISFILEQEQARQHDISELTLIPSDVLFVCMQFMQAFDLLRSVSLVNKQFRYSASSLMYGKESSINNDNDEIHWNNDKEEMQINYWRKQCELVGLYISYRIVPGYTCCQKSTKECPNGCTGYGEHDFGDALRKGKLLMNTRVTADNGVPPPPPMAMPPA